MKILVTGGTGYIGSHTCVELIRKGFDVVIFDNLYNSEEDVPDRIEKITGVRPAFYKADLRDIESMRPVFEDHTFEAVIHFAEKYDLPVVHNTCPADKHTKREEVKDLVYELNGRYPGLKDKVFGAMQRYPLTKWEVKPNPRTDG